MKTCSAKDCYRPFLALGFCRLHYTRYRFGKGAIESTWVKGMPLTLENILANCDVLDSGCRVWRGYRNPAGYGVVARDGSTIGVHRLTHELAIGPIPKDYEVDHVKKRGCISTGCCWPAHLEAVTPAENMRRERQDVCNRGHEDWYVLPSGPKAGRRCCRTCRNEKRRESYAASR